MQQVNELGFEVEEGIGVRLMLRAALDAGDNALSLVYAPCEDNIGNLIQSAKG